jgi:filamin
VKYIPKKAGKYNISVLLDGDDLKNSPFNVVVNPEKEMADVNKTLVDGPGLTDARQFVPNIIKITAKNKDGKIRKGNDDFDISVDGPDSTKTNIINNEDGTYTITYLPNGSGKHKINIKANDEPLKGSPFIVDVRPSPDNNKTTVKNLNKNPICGEKTKFLIDAKDSNGKPFISKRDFDGETREKPNDFEVLIDGPSKIDPKITPNGDGTYTVEYVPQLPGIHNIGVKVVGKELKDSPFEVKAKSGVDPEKSEIIGDKLVDGPPNEPKHFKIVSKDKNGDIRDVNDDIFNVEVDGPYKTPVKITPNGDGTYDVEFIPKVIGDYKIKVTNDDKSLKDSPIDIKIVPKLSPKLSTITQPKLKRIGKPLSLILNLNDEYSNPIRYIPKNMLVRITDPDDNEITPSLIFENDKYNIGFKPKKQGKYIVTPIADGESLKPVIVDVNSGVDIGETLVDGPGIETGVVDQPSLFKIIPKDKNGNEIGNSDDVFDVIVDGPNNTKVKAEVKNCEDGSYDVKYIPKKGGDHKVTVLVNDIPLINSPFEVKVSEGYDDSKTEVDGPGIKKCYKDIPAIFNIKLFDKNGTKHPSPEDIRVEIDGPNGTPIKGIIALDDDGMGNHTVIYYPKETGKHAIKVSVNGSKVKNSPFKVNCLNSDQAPKPSLCLVKQKPLKLKLNEENKFQIELLDKKGNPIKSGGDEVDVEIDGPDGVKVKVTDTGSGKYNISLNPTKPGLYKVKPRVFREVIKDCPFEIQTDGPNIGNSKRSAIIGWGIKIYAPSKKEADFEVTLESKKNKQISQITKDELKNKFIIQLNPVPEDKNESHLVNIKLNGVDVSGSPFKQSF